LRISDFEPNKPSNVRISGKIFSHLMAFCRLFTLHFGFLAQPVESLASSQNRLASKLLKNAGIANHARDARQERRPERDGQPGDRPVVDSALEGSCESVEFGNERAERPANRGIAAVRTARPPCLHKQRTHERDRRIFEGVVAAEETLDDLLAG
jgi:hypothetical protein